MDNQKLQIGAEDLRIKAILEAIHENSAAIRELSDVVKSISMNSSNELEKIRKEIESIKRKV